MHHLIEQRTDMKPVNHLRRFGENGCAVSLM
jgi:hypothetical protein